MLRSIARRLTRELPILSLVAASLWFPSPSLFAQAQAPTGGAVVEGRVVGPDNAPVAGAEVRLRSGGKNVGGSVMTTEDGRFRIEAVPAPGTYEVTCKLGHRTEKGAHVTVQRSGEIVVADVLLALSVSEEVSVSADSWTLPTDVPNSTVTRTAESLSQQNLVNPEDALKYAPSTMIRKRYIGDRNALIGGRSFGTLQPSRGLVFLDGHGRPLPTPTASPPGPEPPPHLRRATPYKGPHRGRRMPRGTYRN